METMLDKLLNYLRVTPQEELDAKYEELAVFLSAGPSATEYLETLPRIDYQKTVYYPTINPEFSLDFLF